MALNYILKEDGSGHILLEDSSGSILLENQGGNATLTFTPTGTIRATGKLLGVATLVFDLIGRIFSPTGPLYGDTSGTNPDPIYDANSGLGSTLYSTTTGTNPDDIYEGNSGAGPFLYYETIGTNPVDPFEEN